MSLPGPSLIFAFPVSEHQIPPGSTSFGHQMAIPPARRHYCPQCSQYLFSTTLCLAHPLLGVIYPFHDPTGCVLPSAPCCGWGNWGFQMIQWWVNLTIEYSLDISVERQYYYSSIFFGGGGCIHGMWKFQDQGSNSCHSSSQSHSSDNAGSLTHWATRELLTLWSCFYVVPKWRNHFRGIKCLAINPWAWKYRAR